jgi:RNA polymerase sigma-70 factor (ECF subfamily)
METTVNRSVTAPDDRALVQKAQAGDRDAFNSLLLRHQDVIFNAVLRLVGEHHRALDLAQEVFLRAFRALASFKGDSAFSTWLYRIALNLCSTERAKRRRPLEARMMSIDAPSRDGEGRRNDLDPADRRARPGDEAMSSEIQARVREAIDALEEEFRSVVVLRDLCDMSYEEMAEVLDCPIGTIRSRLHRARLKLEEALRPVVGGGAPA